MVSMLKRRSTEALKLISLALEALNSYSILIMAATSGSFYLVRNFSKKISQF